MITIYLHQHVCIELYLFSHLRNCLQVNNALTAQECIAIRKTCLYDFDPVKPHFYTVKLRFTGVYIIFLISAKNIDCGYLLEQPH